MSDQDLFKEQNTNNEEQQQNNEETPREPQADPFADLLSEIRNENGEPKYKDVATALNALKSSQSFIEQLKAEKRELEEKHNKTQSELERMGTIDDYVNRLQNKSPKSATADQPKETPKGEGGLSEEQVARLLDERLTARERQAAQAANLERVQSQLKETHGENAAVFLKQKAEELEMTLDELKELASTKPTVALTLLGGQTKSPTKPSQSSVIPPRQAPDNNPMPSWERSAVHGGLTNKELSERWKQAKQFTYKRIKVEE